MADIAPELYEKIKEIFDRKYAQAQILGESLGDIMGRINDGSATFRDADMFAVEVGAMMADAMKQVLVLEDLPGGQLYRNIAQRTIGEGLKDTYGIMSNIAATIQEEINSSNGIGLKAVKPKLESDRVDRVVEKATTAKTQESLDAILDESVPTFSRQVVDDTQKANARLHNKAGLKVTVEREYDGVGLHNGEDVCDWCLSRAGKFDYEKAMDVGAFERHEGCGCIITYTSTKGEITRTEGKYDEWSKISERQKKEEEIIKANNPNVSPQAREVRARYQLAVSKGEGLGESEKIELGWVGKKDIDATIEHFKKEFRLQDREHALVIDGEGNVTMFIGSETNVTLQGVNLDGAHILHNHPVAAGNKSFGEDDFYLIRDCQNGIFDLVDKDYDYHLEVINSIETLSYGQLKDFVKINVGEVLDLNEDYQHLLMQGLAEKGYISYERVKKK